MRESLTTTEAVKELGRARVTELCREQAKFDVIAITDSLTSQDGADKELVTLYLAAVANELRSWIRRA